MGKESIKVLHIDTEKGWRGGQQQVAYLLEAMLLENYDTALVCQPHSQIQRYCAERKLPHFSIRMLGEIDFIAGIRVALLARKRGYNILHLHSGHALAIGLWAKLFYPALKLIAVRRVDFHINKNWLSLFKYKTGLLNKIIGISEAIKQVLIEDGIPPEKVITIHSGVDIHQFDDFVSNKNLRAQYDIPSDHIIVGTIAAMVGHKDYPNLLKAAKIVIEKQDNISFCALGDGPNKSDILDLAQGLQLGKRFVFVGFQENIGQFLKLFDIFVLASHLEGLGTSLLDAKAVGLPVIACETGGISEAVIHGRDGLLVPPKNEQALAEVILMLANDQQLRRKLGTTALTTVKQFDIQNTVHKNMQLYQEILR